MNVVQMANDYFIYDSSVISMKNLPAKVYDINCAPNCGWFLTEIGDTDSYNITEKIYGEHPKKVDKILRSFQLIENRSMGVIFSGDKGLGKSLSMKLLIHNALQLGYPVILCTHHINGLTDFLESIQQPVVVCFDEFDKQFGRYYNKTVDRDVDPMNEMLTLFDGLSQTKKLYVITCNHFRNLNEYLINRPGRMHYHIRFDCPRGKDVREYLTDNVKIAAAAPEIDKCVKFSQRIPLNYDCLRAIAFELNLGEKFEDAINDLNIINAEAQEYWITVTLEKGQNLYGVVKWNPFGNEPQNVLLYKTKGDGESRYHSEYSMTTITLIPIDAEIADDGTLSYDPTQIKLEPYDLDEEEQKEWDKEYKDNDVVKCEITPKPANTYRFLY